MMNTRIWLLLSQGNGKTETTVENSIQSMLKERDPIKLSSHLHHGRMGKQHWVYWSSNKRLTTLFGTKANKRLTSLLGIMMRFWDDTKANKRFLPYSAYTLRWDFTITNKRFTSLFGANIVDDNFTDLMTTNKRSTSLFGADFDDENLLIKILTFKDRWEIHWRFYWWYFTMKMMMIKSQLKQNY